MGLCFRNQGNPKFEKHCQVDSDGYYMEKRTGAVLSAPVFLYHNITQNPLALPPGWGASASGWPWPRSAGPVPG